MTEIIRSHPITKFLIIAVITRWTAAYENAYDLAERRGQFRTNPNNRFYESSERYYNRFQDRDRYSTHNQRPASVYSTIRDPGFVSRGNGYDNIGNSGVSDRFRSRDWKQFPEPRRSWRGDSIQRDESFRPDDSFRRRFDDGLFRNQDPIEDRRPVDSFRNADPIEDRFLDLSRNPGSLDDKRSIDAFRDVSRIEPSRSLADESFERPRVIDLPRRIDVPFKTRPRSREPEFYRKDYFRHQPAEKSSGFDSETSDKNFQSAVGGKENSAVSTVGSYITSNQDQNQQKKASGFHDNTEGAKLDVANKEKIGETTRFDKNGGNKSSVRSNRVTKKGHATKGFATHHHKDETGNSTTFFDESSDAGGQSDYQDLEDEFGSRKTMEILNGKEDGRFFEEKGGKSGNFGSGVLRDNKVSKKDIVAKDNRFNQEEKFGDGQDQFDRGFQTASEYLGGGVWNDEHHGHV